MTRNAGRVAVDRAEPRAPRDERRAGRHLAAVAWASAGGVLTSAVVIADPWFRDTVGAAPVFLAWLSLIGMQGLLAGAAGVGACRAAGLAWRECDPAARRTGVAAGLLVAALLAVELGLAPLLFPLANDLPHPMQDHSARVAVISTAIALSAILSTTAMWLSAFAGTRRADTRTAVQELLQARERVRWLLWLLGAQVGLATLSTGMLRHAMVSSEAALRVLRQAAGPLAGESAFPEALVLAYGSYFAAVLAIFYLPLHLRLVERGRVLRDRLIADEPDAEAWGKRRKELGELLDLDASFGAMLKDVVAIAAPIIAGYVSLALPGH